MKKYITLIAAGLCLAIVNTAFADQTPALRDDAWKDAYNAAAALKGQARRDALWSMWEVYGDLITAKLIAEEQLRDSEDTVWAEGYARENSETPGAVHFARVEHPSLHPAYRVRQSHAAILLRYATDDEVLVGWEGPRLNTEELAVILYKRQWGSQVKKDEYREALIATQLDRPGFGPLWTKFIREHLGALPVEDAIPVVEQQIRVALTQTPSDARDNWIKERRAQHVILKGLQD